MQSFIDNLDETAMKAAADFAYKESLSQKTIPHSEILNVVSISPLQRKVLTH